jgi:hypothetical protein
MLSEIEPPILCVRPVEIEYSREDDVFYVTDPALRTRRAFRPIALLRSFQNAAIAIQQFHGLEEPEADVIQLRIAG